MSALRCLNTSHRNLKATSKKAKAKATQDSTTSEHAKFKLHCLGELLNLPFIHIIHITETSLLRNKTLAVTSIRRVSTLNIWECYGMWQVSVLLSVTFTVQRLKLQGLLGILFALPLEIVPQLSIMIRSLSCFLTSSILLRGETNPALSLSPAGEFISKPLGSFCLGTSVAWLLFLQFQTTAVAGREMQNANSSFKASQEKSADTHQTIPWAPEPIGFKFW